MTKREEELRKLFDMIYELPNDLSANIETGSHHRNNEAAAEWMKHNHILWTAIIQLINYAETIDPN